MVEGLTYKGNVNIRYSKTARSGKQGGDIKDERGLTGKRGSIGKVEDQASKTRVDHGKGGDPERRKSAKVSPSRKVTESGPTIVGQTEKKIYMRPKLTPKYLGQRKQKGGTGGGA